MSADNSQRKAYEFLFEKARSQASFTPQDLGDATGWKGSTPKTNLGKQLKSVVSKKEGKFRVNREFIHLTLESFIERTSQKENILPRYKRTGYDSVIIYEFLMPLTREDLLKAALDKLFYKDSLSRLLKLLGLKRFEPVLPRHNASDEAYAKTIVDAVSDRFGGYSISHVAGRFRVCDILSQQESIDRRYVVDETTAVVKFIFPIQQSGRSFADSFTNSSAPSQQTSETENEIKLIRTLFFEIFAEVVVHSVQGEDVIWLLENVAGRQKLFTWENL